MDDNSFCCLVFQGYHAGKIARVSNSRPESKETGKNNCKPNDKNEGVFQFNFFEEPIQSGGNSQEERGGEKKYMAGWDKPQDPQDEKSEVHQKNERVNAQEKCARRFLRIVTDLKKVHYHENDKENSAREFGKDQNRIMVIETEKIQNNIIEVR